ncbi:MAG: excinuclease ABC subunit UvrC [Francisellaceae bacterium]
MISFHQRQFDLQKFLNTLTTLPGVYRMIDEQGQIIYIGKAKNLKKRISSYFNKGAKDQKTLMMVDKIDRIEVTLTRSDYEAFLLESTLIKKHRPRYNITFKDDKSYPYLVLSRHRYPRVYGFRGRPDKKKGQFFGPYVALSSMKETLVLLQKLFPLRQCEDSYFKARSRPCLQFQIGRCSAPCVDFISESDYADEAGLLRQFLQGKLTAVLAIVSEKMHAAAIDQQFEKAAKYRDQLMLLRKLQEQQIIDAGHERSFHVIGISQQQNQYCLSLLEVERGKLIADRYWIIDDYEGAALEVLSAFLSQYYLNEDRNLWPDEIILPKTVNVDDALLKVISLKAEKTINWIVTPVKDKAKWQQLAALNARQKLIMHLDRGLSFKARWQALQKWLDAKNLQRVECFDISHFQGEATVASCVVYDDKGAVKPQFRRYNIKGITPGDDYAAMYQVLKRRISAGLEAGNLPDMMIIDGGLGQLKEAEKIITEFSLQDQIRLVSLGKGVERISGKEDIYRGFDSKAHHLPEHDSAFLLLREIRDQAHEFAIKAQRKSLRKRQGESIIDTIEGVGAKRRKALLSHFGGWQELSKASADEIAKVKGISSKLAAEIWQTFH